MFFDNGFYWFFVFTDEYKASPICKLLDQSHILVLLYANTNIKYMYTQVYITLLHKTCVIIIDMLRQIDMDGFSPFYFYINCYRWHMVILFLGAAHLQIRNGFNTLSSNQKQIILFRCIKNLLQIYDVQKNWLDFW